MTLDISQHPCFNAGVRHQTGRIHLPVAPRCNVSCNFCNRKFHCVNESRPGVTAEVLNPQESLKYLALADKLHTRLTVAGIAGPGDPFANPEETLETLRLIRDHYPEILLCLASNGMNASAYVDKIAAMDVSHVTITVNTLNPVTGAKIYRWVRDGYKVLRGENGAARLLAHQIDAIQNLKAAGMIVKINTLVIPGINEGEIEDIAREMALLKVDLLNCIPLYPATASQMEHHPLPGERLMRDIRKRAGKYLPQMRHCTRCRADAAGPIGKNNTQQNLMLMKKSRMLGIPSGYKTCVAVASHEGSLINMHLGEAPVFHIYGNNNGTPFIKELRAAPDPGCGDLRWNQLADTLKDCFALIVSAAGNRPIEVLKQRGISLIIAQGLIQDALIPVFKGKEPPAYMTVKCPPGCSKVSAVTSKGCNA